MLGHTTNKRQSSFGVLFSPCVCSPICQSQQKLVTTCFYHWQKEVTTSDKEKQLTTLNECISTPSVFPMAPRLFVFFPRESFCFACFLQVLSGTRGIPSLSVSLSLSESCLRTCRPSHCGFVYDAFNLSFPLLFFSLGRPVLPPRGERHAVSSGNSLLFATSVLRT